MSVFSSRLLAAGALFLPALLICMTVEGIIIRHDRGDSRYVVNEEEYPQVFSLHRRFGNRVCVATLIHPRWAITAAHCIDETPIGTTLARQEAYTVDVAGQPRRVVDMARHPDYKNAHLKNSVDLALLKFGQEVADVTPVPLYREREEQGREVVFLGWGYSGVGTVGLSFNDGRLRRAYNRVMEAGQWLVFRFDDPRESEDHSLPLEGVPGLGDSGGPALLERDNGMVLAGVALGEMVNSDPEAAQGKYGAIEFYERISSHIEWIEAHLQTL